MFTVLIEYIVLTLKTKGSNLCIDSILWKFVSTDCRRRERNRLS